MQLLQLFMKLQGPVNLAWGLKAEGNSQSGSVPRTCGSCRGLCSELWLPVITAGCLACLCPKIVSGVGCEHPPLCFFCLSADSRSMNLTQISVDAVTVRRHLAVSGGVHSDSCLGVLLAVSLLVACVVIHVSSLAVFRLHQQWKVSLWLGNSWHCCGCKHPQIRAKGQRFNLVITV